MFYHCRPLEFVQYGKVYPPPPETIEPDFLNVYEWLGQHCGYSPQVWLSRSRSQITGYRSWYGKSSESKILFGFENIVGFPVDYTKWEFFMTDFMNGKTLAEAINGNIKWIEEERKSDPDYDYGSDKHFSHVYDYDKLGEEAYLKKHLFVENDQVVVPSLNLKAAKVVFCRNEKEVKVLRKMGFINDRIRIKK